MICLAVFSIHSKIPKPDFRYPDIFEIPSIILLCPFGDEYKKVEIRHECFGDGNWSVNIDKYYCGNILFANNEWLNHLNKKTELTIDDFQIITKIIEDHLYSLLPK